MLAEALECAQVVQRQVADNKALMRKTGAALRAFDPAHVVTIARGSSDHAASFFGYLVMSQLGRWVTSLPMSLVTVERAPLPGKGVAAFAFSQSGQSPDLIAPIQYLRRNQAETFALVNAQDSPLARAAQIYIALHAGAENSVAATKSFVAQLCASVHLVAAWADDDALLAALDALPQALRLAAGTSWQQHIDRLSIAQRLFVIGRGAGLAIAQEAALKFKETCGIQAEAFSGAEVKHGPMALIEPGYPLLIFAPRGPGQTGLIDLAREMRTRGADVLLAATSDSAVPPDLIDLPVVPAPHLLLDPLCMAQSFYIFVEALARVRGRSPDEPRHLAKVTRTR
jgi:glucosamine--fructose-6-phosphate aminotransferase (isomerizing)